jgi:hypothetical protein
MTGIIIMGGKDSTISSNAEKFPLLTSASSGLT